MPATILKALAVATESTFGAHDTDQSNYARIPAEEIAFTPEQEHLARPVQSQTLGHHQTGIVGRKGGTLTFRIGLHGLQSAATGAASEYAWMKPLLEACGYTRSAGTGTTVDGSSATTTSVPVVSAAGLAVGQLVVIGGEARLVTDIIANTLTVAPALSSAPGDSDPVHAAASYWLTGSEPSESVSFIAKMDGHSYIAAGCNGVVAIDSVSAGQRPMLTFTFNVDRWTRSVSGLTSTYPALSMPNGIVARASPFWWGATRRAVREVGFNPGQTIVEKASTEGDQGRAGWAYSNAEPALSAVAHRSTDANDALQTDYETPTTRTLLMQLGSAPGRMAAIAAEVAQLTSYPAEGDAEGLVTLPVEAAVKSPSTSGLPPFALGFA